DFRRSDRGRPVKDLPLQVRLIDDVVVDQSNRAHAGSGKIDASRGAQSSSSNQENFALQKFELSRFADLWNSQMAAVSRHLIFSDFLRSHERHTIVLPVVKAPLHGVDIRIAQVL